MSRAPKEVDVNEELLRKIDKGADSDRAAREHLAAGFPIYYREASTPADLQIKKYPDGRRELVRFNRAGDEVIRQL